MKRVLISGSSGLIGGALARSLRSDGIEVVPLVRKPARSEGGVGWDPAGGTIDAPALEGFDAIVHLAGENIASGRWTSARKQRIRDSRVAGTSLLARALTTSKTPPPVLVSASAVGYYGDTGDAPADESTPAGEGFLADVCTEWERSSLLASPAVDRIVICRFGVVLSQDGGALRKMLTPFRLGLGGPLGSGSQYMSWIAVDDAISAIRFALARNDVSGPLNITAPEPVTNDTFTRLLATTLGRPAIFRVPRSALRLMLGDMADEALLASSRAVPKRLIELGFHFSLPRLEGALAHILQRR